MILAVSTMSPEFQVLFYALAFGAFLAAALRNFPAGIGVGLAFAIVVPLWNALAAA